MSVDLQTLSRGLQAAVPPGVVVNMRLVDSYVKVRVGETTASSCHRPLYIVPPLELAVYNPCMCVCMAVPMQPCVH